MSVLRAWLLFALHTPTHKTVSHSQLPPFGMADLFWHNRGSFVAISSSLCQLKHLTKRPLMLTNYLSRMSPRRSLLQSVTASGSDTTPYGWHLYCPTGFGRFTVSTVAGRWPLIWIQVLKSETFLATDPLAFPLRRTSILPTIIRPWPTLSAVSLPFSLCIL